MLRGQEQYIHRKQFATDPYLSVFLACRCSRETKGVPEPLHNRGAEEMLTRKNVYNLLVGSR